jgi:hypothetical protein
MHKYYLFIYEICMGIIYLQNSYLNQFSFLENLILFYWNLFNLKSQMFSEQYHSMMCSNRALEKVFLSSIEDS